MFIYSLPPFTFYQPITLMYSRLSSPWLHLTSVEPALPPSLPPYLPFPPWILSGALTQAEGRGGPLPSGLCLPVEAQVWESSEK